MKKILLLLSAVILLGSVPLAVFLVRQGTEIRSKAAPATSLTFSPETKTICLGESFPATIEIETGANQVVSADLVINYDPDIFDILDVRVGPFLTGAQEIQKNVNSVDGVITESFYTTKANAKTGTGTFLTMTLKGKAVGTDEMMLDTTLTKLFGLTENQNIWVKNQASGVYTVEECDDAEPTPTPTSPPAATGTPVPTGTPAPTSPPAATGIPSQSLPAFRITYPPTGAVLTTGTPTFQGTGAAGCTVTLSLTGSATLTAVTTTGANFYWGYTVPSPLPDGSYQLTATEQCSTGAPRNDSTSFSIRTQQVPVTGNAATTVLTVIVGAALMAFGLRFLPL